MKKPFFLITQVVKHNVSTVDVDAMFLMLKTVLIVWYKGASKLEISKNRYNS